MEGRPTLDDQFVGFAKGLDVMERTGSTITLYNSDYWLRQARILDDRNLTMTETGKLFFDKYSSKTEINFQEWVDYIKDLCELKGLDFEQTKELLTICGRPGDVSVDIPQYHDYFDNFTPKPKF